MNKLKYISSSNIVLLLVFLFPIAGTFVRHWISDILGLLFFVSIYYYFKGDRTQLFAEEKKWLSGFAVYFSVFILTAVMNGWTEEQTSWLGLEIRFLLIIPIYLMLREIKNIELAFFYGLLTGLVAVSIWGGYEIFILKLERTWGTYSSLFIGPVTLLVVSLVVAKGVNSFTDNKKENIKNFIYISIPITTALMVVALSGGRSAYLGFVAIVGLYFFYYIRNLKVVIPLLIIVLSFVIIVFNIDFVHQRVITAQQETLNYLQSDDKANFDISTSSSGVRLEMWRGSWYLIKASPIFGVGRGNYYNAMQEYIDAGLVNPAVTVGHSHPHNAFVETTVSRGILGIVVMLFILYYPFYLFYKYRKKSPTTALMGMTHIILITIFSLTEAATFIKGNFVAINLIFLSIILSSHLREVNSIHTQ